MRRLVEYLGYTVLAVVLVIGVGLFAYFVGAVWTPFWAGAPWWAFAIFPALVALLFAVALAATIGQKLIGHLWPSRFGDWRRYDWFGKARY